MKQVLFDVMLVCSQSPTRTPFIPLSNMTDALLLLVLFHQVLKVQEKAVSQELSVFIMYSSICRWG